MTISVAEEKKNCDIQKNLNLTRCLDLHHIDSLESQHTQTCWEMNKISLKKRRKQSSKGLSQYKLFSDVYQRITYLDCSSFKRSVLETGGFIPMHRRIQVVSVKLFKTMQTRHCAPATPSRVQKAEAQTARMENHSLKSSFEIIYII